jgi:hypothetical protein
LKLCPAAPAERSVRERDRSRLDAHSCAAPPPCPRTAFSTAVIIARPAGVRHDGHERVIAHDVFAAARAVRVLLPAIGLARRRLGFAGWRVRRGLDDAALPLVHELPQWVQFIRAAAAECGHGVPKTPERRQRAKGLGVGRLARACFNAGIHAKGPRLDFVLTVARMFYRGRTAMRARH